MQTKKEKILAAIKKLDTLQKNTPEYRENRNFIDAEVYCLTNARRLQSWFQDKKTLILNYKSIVTGQAESARLELPLYAESFRFQYEFFPLIGSDFKLEEYGAGKNKKFVCKIKAGDDYTIGLALSSIPLACLYTRVMVL